MFETRATLDLIRIATSGGGFEINVSARPTHELISIASAARQGGAVVTFKGLGMRRTEEIIQISQAGIGHVQFSD